LRNIKSSNVASNSAVMNKRSVSSKPLPIYNFQVYNNKPEST